jgi:MFS family permease
MTGLGFILAGTVCMFIDEPADKPAKVKIGWRHHIQEAWRIWSTDRDFRILAVAAMLFVMIQLAFPHFQLLGKQTLAREGVDVQSHGFHLMIWVVSQNAAVGIFSLISGLIADRWGNRLAIRIQVFAVSLAPVGALLLGSGLIDSGVWWYGIVFFLLGLAPVTFSTLNNYVLELAVTSDHPRYVSTLSVCMAVPFCFSPLVGALLDHFGFPVVFTFITALIALGGAMTFWMSEPRHNESGPSRV